MRSITIASTAALLLTTAAPAQTSEPTAELIAACAESITVFQDVSKIGRKDRLAANITRRHRDMARDRWRFVDMEIYVENADIEGAFLSYSRTVPCPVDTSPND